MDFRHTGLPDVEASLERVTRRVGNHYQGLFGPEQVHTAVRASFDRLQARNAMPGFVMALTEHESIERLRVAGLRQGVIPKVHPEVLFVSAGGARAELAAALTEARSDDRVIVRVTSERAHVERDPNVDAVLKEIGIERRALKPAPLTDDALAAADAVVTMGCAELPGGRDVEHHVDWQVPAPEGTSLEDVRQLRDELDKRVKDLLRRLSPVEAGNSESA